MGGIEKQVDEIKGGIEKMGVSLEEGGESGGRGGEIGKRGVRLEGGGEIEGRWVCG